MSVHYKFKSTLNFDTITFDGLHISVGDLKREIVQQKRLGKIIDFDLQITNAQSKEGMSPQFRIFPLLHGFLPFSRIQGRWVPYSQKHNADHIAHPHRPSHKKGLGATSSRKCLFGGACQAGQLQHGPVQNARHGGGQNPGHDDAEHSRL